MIYIVVAVVLIAVLGFFLTPKAKSTETEPIKNLEIPTNEAGNLPVLFGTRQILSPKIAWYGDLRILKQNADTQRKKG